MKKDVLETLKRDLSLIGLMCFIKKPITTWKFLKSLFPEEESKVVLGKYESYLRKVLNRWSSYGLITKENVNGRTIYCVNTRKIKVVKKRNYWIMIVELPDFQIHYKVKPSNKFENQTKS